jgi:hypothetical protein
VHITQPARAILTAADDSIAWAKSSTLRASVGSTEAAKDVVARFGVVGPKRAT